MRAVAPEEFDQWSRLWEGYNAFYGRSGETRLAEDVTRVTWSRFFMADEPVHGLVAQISGELVGLAHYLFTEARPPLLLPVTSRTCSLQTEQGAKGSQRLSSDRSLSKRGRRGLLGSTGRPMRPMNERGAFMIQSESDPGSSSIECSCSSGPSWTFISTSSGDFPVQMDSAPLPNSMHQGTDRAAVFGELVFDVRWRKRMDCSHDQSLFLKITQRLRQHLVRDVWHQAPKLVEAPCACVEEVEANETPFATYRIERRGHRAVGHGRRLVGIAIDRGRPQHSNFSGYRKVRPCIIDNPTTNIGSTGEAK